MNAIESLRYFLPETFLLIGAFFILILDLFLKNKKGLGVLSILVLIFTGLLAKSPEASLPLFDGFFTLDNFSHYFRLIALFVCGISILITLAYKPLPQSLEGENYGFFLFMAFGLILMASSTNLIMIFMAMEFVSIMSYLMVGFLKKDPLSKEAAIKYLLFGSLASGIMLFGMTLLYGISGSLELSVIGKNMNHLEVAHLHLIALVLVLSGLAFKIAAAPFHMWAPDAYQAAPTPVTALLTVGPKALGFALLLRIFTEAFVPLYWKWSHVISIISILTMTFGNFTAIGQSNIKRLLAYSSIAQAGYILMGIAASNQPGISGILVYVLAYAFTNIGAFTAVIMVSNHTGDDSLKSYEGLSERSPFLAAALTIFLLSLAGLPPLAGFIGKFFVFSAVIQGGHITLAVAAALNSAVAAYYYFRIVRAMYLVKASESSRMIHPWTLQLALLILLAGTLVIGLVPQPFLELVQNALA